MRRFHYEEEKVYCLTLCSSDKCKSCYTSNGRRESGSRNCIGDSSRTGNCRSGNNKAGSPGRRSTSRRGSGRKRSTCGGGRRTGRRGCTCSGRVNSRKSRE